MMENIFSIMRGPALRVKRKRENFLDTAPRGGRPRARKRGLRFDGMGNCAAQKYRNAGIPCMIYHINWPDNGMPPIRGHGMRDMNRPSTTTGETRRTILRTGIPMARGGY